MQKIRNPVCASFFEVANQAHSVPQFTFDSSASMETFHSGACFRGRIENCCILQEYRSVNRVSLSLVVGFIVLTVGGPKPVRAQQQAPSATFGSIIGLGGAPSDIVLDELRSRLYLVNN